MDINLHVLSKTGGEIINVNYAKDMFWGCTLFFLFPVSQISVDRSLCACSEEERFHGDQDCLVCGQKMRLEEIKSGETRDNCLKCSLPVRLNLKRHGWRKCQLSLGFIEDSGRKSLAFFNLSGKKADHLSIKYISRTHITVKPVKGCELKKLKEILPGIFTGRHFQCFPFILFLQYVCTVCFITNCLMHREMKHMTEYFSASLSLQNATIKVSFVVLSPCCGSDSTNTETN